MDLTPSFRDAFAAFAVHEVRYIVCGSYAVAAHGCVRYVKDLDLWIEPTPDNARRTIAALAAFGFGDLGITEADFAGDIAVELGYEPILIDLITSLRDLAFADAHAARVVATVDGVDIPLLDRDRSIYIKRLIGRTQDALDLAALEAVDAGARPSPADGLRELERLRRAHAGERGDPDRPIARAVRRKELRERVVEKLRKRTP